MRRRMVSELITLDGVVEASRRRAGPPDTGWVFDDQGPELEAYKRVRRHLAPSRLFYRPLDLSSAPERGGRR